MTELETLAVVWSVSHFHAYLYGHKVTIRTDQSAVKAILVHLENTHAGGLVCMVEEDCIVHRSGREHADTLSRSPIDPAPDEGDAEAETQVAVVLSAHRMQSLESMLWSRVRIPS